MDAFQGIRYEYLCLFRLGTIHSTTAVATAKGEPGDKRQRAKQRERERETGNITYTQQEQLAAPQSKVETVLSSFKVHASGSNCYTLTLLYRTSVRLNQIIYI